MKKKLLFIEPREYDRRELGRDVVKNRYEILSYSVQDTPYEPIMCEGIGKIGDQFDPSTVFEELVTLCEHEKIEGILFSIDYPGALFASALVEAKQFHGPSMAGMVLCQHKYESRKKQKELVPHATPQFMLVDGTEFDTAHVDFPFPLFVKPVKSSFSILAYSAADVTELQRLVSTFAMPKAFLDQFNWFTKDYEAVSLTSTHMLVEECAQGFQVTLEGYVFNGLFTCIGVVDSVFFPNSLSFKRFEYPSRLSPSIQLRMETIARDFVLGIGLNNTLFNIEFMYDFKTDRILIIEVHSRMSAQFADLYEKVDGTNSYDILLSLALGREPQLHRRNGLHNVAASFVLRTFEDKLVVATPSMIDQQSAYERFPDFRFYTEMQPGMRLSDVKQDGKSYRYGLIHLGGRDWRELGEKFEECKRLLPFAFGKA